MGLKIETSTPGGVIGGGRIGRIGEENGGGPGSGTVGSNSGMPHGMSPQVAADSFVEPGVTATNGTVAVPTTALPGAAQSSPEK